MNVAPEAVSLLVVGLVRRDGDVLMVRQAETDQVPYWTLPGGRVEPNEPLLDALTREVREETGVGIADPELLYVKQVLVPVPYENMLVFVFAGAPAKTDATAVPEDPDGLILEAGYLPVDEAIGHLEDLFGPDEPSVAHLAGREIPSIVTVRHVPSIWR
jgi:8-oxo-dGTP diphosphatase